MGNVVFGFARALRPIVFAPAGSKFARKIFHVGTDTRHCCLGAAAAIGDENRLTIFSAGRVQTMYVRYFFA